MPILNAGLPIQFNTFIASLFFSGLIYDNVVREISESKNVGLINDYVARLVIIYLLRMSLFFITNLTPFSYLNRATIKLIAFSKS